VLSQLLFAVAVIKMESGPVFLNIPVMNCRKDTLGRNQFSDEVRMSRLICKSKDFCDLLLTFLDHLKQVRMIIGTSVFLSELIQRSQSSQVNLAFLDLAVDSAHIMELIFLSKLYRGQNVIALCSENKLDFVQRISTNDVTSLAHCTADTSKKSCDKSCQTTYMDTANKLTQTECSEQQILKNMAEIASNSFQNGNLEAKANLQYELKQHNVEKCLKNTGNTRKRKRSSEIVAGDSSDLSTRCSMNCKKSRCNGKHVMSNNASRRLPSVTKRQRRFSKRLLATNTGVKDSVKSSATLSKYHTSSKNKLRNDYLLTKQVLPSSNQHTSRNCSTLLDHLDIVLDSVARNASNTPSVPSVINKTRRSHKRKQSCPLRSTRNSHLPLELRRLDIAMVTNPINNENNSNVQQEIVTENDELASCRVVVKRLSTGNCLNKSRLRNRWKERQKVTNAVKHSLVVHEEKIATNSVDKKINGKIVVPNSPENQVWLQHSKSIVKLAASTKNMDVDHCKVKLTDCVNGESKTKRSPLPLETKRKQPRSAIRKVEVSNCSAEASSSQKRCNLFSTLHVDVSNNCENVVTSPCSPLPDSMCVLDELCHQDSPVVIESLTSDNDRY